jgi:hypothetical protein
MTFVREGPRVLSVSSQFGQVGFFFTLNHEETISVGYQSRLDSQPACFAAANPQSGRGSQSVGARNLTAQ